MENKSIEDVIATVLKEFNKVAKQRECPDQKVTTITFSDENILVPGLSVWERNDITETINDNNKVVIVLESPHREEFESNKPIGPANGKTGINICAKLKEVLVNIRSRDSENRITNDSVYDLYLVNAINFQCSLGLPTNFFRDLVFIGCWFNSGKEDFKRRIRGLNLQGNDILLNSCTLGSHSEFRDMFGSKFSNSKIKKLLGNDSINFRCSDGLRSLVHDAIEEVFKEEEISPLYQNTNHPVMWDRAIIYR